jgi:Gpi18-like mannosyltransferase
MTAATSNFNAKKILTVIADNPIWIAGICFFLYRVFNIPNWSMDWDRYSFLTWCQYIQGHGLTSAYHVPSPDFNYPPLITYPLWLFGKLMPNAGAIDRNFRYFKLLGLTCDFITAYLVIKLTTTGKLKLVHYLLLIANPAFIYNSYYWGQVDGVLAVLIFASFYCVMQNKLMGAFIFFMLSLNFKIMAIIFLPPFVLLGTWQFWKRVSARELMIAIFATLALQLIILLPFIIAGEIAGVIKSITGSVDYYPIVSKGAYNFWALCFGERAFKMTDDLLVANISLKHIGLALFFIFSALALLPLLRYCYKRVWQNGEVNATNNLIFLTMALIPLLFFYFNTQMHERYSHLALMFAAAFAFSSKRYLVFLMLCAAYFLNLEYFNCSFGALNNYHSLLFFQPWFASVLYGLVIVLLFYHLYAAFNRPQIQQT